MTPSWQRSFSSRMRGFEAMRPPGAGEVAASIKVRVVSGCFHREHSPHAYDLIDKHLDAIAPKNRNFAFVEHESGPEILVYLAVTTAGITLAKSVIDLVTVIIKARSDSVKKGDRPSEPIELIVRRVDRDDEYREEVVLRVGLEDKVLRKTMQKEVKSAVARLVAGKRRRQGR
jgi:hypothetical protein